MSKPYTGISPFAQTGRGLVLCADHQADYWVPVIKGHPVKVAGKALRYASKAEAQASLYTALKRRAGPTRRYRLGTPMGKKSQ